jgi:alpha-beta hydrolase superfamily lysophospholipase
MDSTDTPDPTPPRAREAAGSAPGGVALRRLATILFLALAVASVIRSPLSSALLLVAVGGLLVVFLGMAASKRRGEIAPWHTLELEEEFRAGCGDGSFAAYLEREERLFAELREKLALVSASARADAICRFRRGSPSDPEGYATNWNRSFELAPPPGEARCGVLLLHGMSDSPYSLRAVGQRLRNEGAHVVGLRLPGHGTAPSGLLSVHRRDLAAAARLALDHLRTVLGDRPLLLVGYSTGGALAIELALDALEDGARPAIDGIVLLSPSIGVSPLAKLAVWQGRAGRWLGFEKLAWTRVLPEYDPYKYQSFAVNAGHQVHRLTEEIGRRLDRLGAGGDLGRFPAILAFQSAVDDTVSTSALIRGLFSKLPCERHELVLFDVNRIGLIESLIAKDPREALTELVLSSATPFALTVLANRDPHSLALEERRYFRAGGGVERSDPGLSWPSGVYSLSHVALPFPPDDPLYGNVPGPDCEGASFQIGNLVLRGERGTLRIPATEQVRLRWNPFYGWLEDRLAAFVAGRCQAPHDQETEGA